MYEFGEYLPDLPPLLNPGLTEAANILPSEIGYLPFPSLAAASVTPIAENPQGGISVRDPSAVGTNYTYIGTATKLYYFNSGAFTDVSGAVYTIAVDDTWSFAQWSNQVVATDFADVIQVTTIGGVAFSALGGSPPKARHLGVVDNFLVVGNTWDAVDLYQPQRVRWSGIGDITSWTVSSVTQASFLDLENNGGFIQGIVGGDYGLIFQERCITRMTYIGSPIVFQFDQLETQRGAYIAGSIIPIGNNVAYIAEDGFFVFDGYQSIPIGRGKVDNTFFNEINRAYLHKVSSTIYPGEQIICWSYPTLSSADGTPDKILFYNYSPAAKTRWSYALLDHEYLLSPLSSGYTLDNMDGDFPNLDLIPISFDSPFWSGNQKLLGAIQTDLNMGFFEGTAMSAVIETGEFDFSNPRRTSISLVRPHIDASSAGGTVVTVQMAGRDLETSTGAFQTAVSLNSAGFAPVRINNRYVKARINIAGGFNHAEGMDLVQSTPVGRR